MQASCAPGSLAGPSVIASPRAAVVAPRVSPPLAESEASCRECRETVRKLAQATHPALNVV